MIKSPKTTAKITINWILSPIGTTAGASSGGAGGIGWAMTFRMLSRKTPIVIIKLWSFFINGAIKKVKAYYAYFLPNVIQIKDIVCLKKSKHRKKNVFQLNYLHLNINTKKALQICKAF